MDKILTDEELEEKLFQTCQIAIAGAYPIFKQIAKSLLIVTKDYAESVLRLSKQKGEQEMDEMYRALNN